MKLSAGIRMAVAAAALVGSFSIASAQEIAESHLKAARSAMTALKATDQFDSILPQAAQFLKVELIQKDPHLQELIVKTVDQKAIEIAARRGDLEREAALAFARAFSEQELNEIAAFHSTPTGQKFLSDSVIVGREISKAADIWQRGIARDLAQGVAAEIGKVAPMQSAAPAPAAEPAAESAATEGAAEPAPTTLTPPAN